MKKSKFVLMLCVVLCMMLALIPTVISVKAQATDAQIITINMHDAYGDGWGNNAINILENGVLIDTATFSQGKEGTWSYTIDPGKDYAFVWVKGAWSSECFFEILINGETVFTATTTDCNLFLDGTVLYPPCEHPNLNAVVTPPSCTEDGFTTYTCTKCGESFVDDETSAIGHQYGDDDFCDVCGYDKNSVPVTITMSDSFGDGWNGNAILVYEDDALIATVTLAPGNRNGTWSYFMDSRKSYDFFWKKGNFANECSFTISVDGEVVMNATQSDCNGFKDNHVLYPPCTHTDCDAVVTPPTCTKYGFTTYTCKKCGHTSIGNIEFALGHFYGDDEIAVHHHLQATTQRGV